MTQNAEMAPGLTGPFQKSNAVVAEATVAHPSDTPRRGGKGTREVRTPRTDRQGEGQSTGRMLGTIRRLIIRAYWATAKARYQRGDYVDYGSPDWCALDIEDPRKLAGLVAFAELWRKYSPEIADDLNRQLRAPESLWQRPTRAELDQAHRLMVAANRHSSRREAA